LFQDDFKNFDVEDFNIYGPTKLQRLRAYLRYGGVYVEQDSKYLSIAQSLIDILKSTKLKSICDFDAEIRQAGPIRADLLKGPITLVRIRSLAPVALPVEPTAKAPLLVDASTTPSLQAPVELPFASFRQEPIPLYLQNKELLEERQERRQKRVQNPPTALPTPKSRYSPQSSTCRHCNENFSSRNALFRHLKLCKSSRSRASSARAFRASSVTSNSSASLSSRISRASSTSSASSATSVSSTSSITSIEKLQLQILSQLYAIRSPTIRRPQDLPFSRKNDLLYGSPQKSIATKSTAVPHPPKSSATQSTTDTPPPVESYTPETLKSTVNASTATTTTAVPYTSTFLTTENPKRRITTRNRRFARRNRLIKEQGYGNGYTDMEKTKMGVFGRLEDQTRLN
jgi:hypothetical protein